MAMCLCLYACVHVHVCCWLVYVCVVSLWAWQGAGPSGVIVNAQFGGASSLRARDAVKSDWSSDGGGSPRRCVLSAADDCDVQQARYSAKSCSDREKSETDRLAPPLRPFGSVVALAAAVAAAGARLKALCEMLEYVWFRYRQCHGRSVS